MRWTQQTRIPTSSTLSYNINNLKINPSRRASRLPAEQINYPLCDTKLHCARAHEKAVYAYKNEREPYHVLTEFIFLLITLRVVKIPVIVVRNSVY